MNGYRSLLDRMAGRLLRVSRLPLAEDGSPDESRVVHEDAQAVALVQNALDFTAQEIEHEANPQASEGRREYDAGRPVIFLDMDGVLNTPRVWEATQPRTGNNQCWIDPIGVAFLRDLEAEFGTRLVVSSTWRKGLRDHLNPTALAMHGLTAHWDYRTRSLDSNRRGDEIAEWLKRHPDVTRYVILDDEYCDMSLDQIVGHLAACHIHNGITVQTMRRVRQILGAVDPIADARPQPWSGEWMLCRVKTYPVGGGYPNEMYEVLRYHEDPLLKDATLCFESTNHTRYRLGDILSWQPIDHGWYPMVPEHYPQEERRT